MKAQKFNPDDPKWTAYVLGELDEAERAGIEQLLESSGEARALIEDLRLATATLKEELTPLTSFAMTPEQKAAIISAAQPVSRGWFQMLPAKWGWAMAATAAVAVLGVTSVMVVNRGAQDPNGPIAQVAENRPQVEEVKAEEAATPSEPAAAPKLNVAEQQNFEEARARTGESKSDRQEGVSSAAPPPAPDTPTGAVGGVAGGTDGGPFINPNLPEELRGNVSLRSREEAAPPAAGASGGEVLPRQQVANLPLVGNNVLELTQIMPGAAAPAPASQPIATSSATVGGGAAGVLGGGRGGAGGGGRGAAAGAAPSPSAIFGQGQQQISATRDGLSVSDGRFATPPPPPPGLANNFAYVSPNTEAYDRIVDNPFIRTTQQNLATFSIDVDTASYANVRRFLTQNQRPPRDAVRIEEMINYFSYDYAQPTGNAPIAPNMEVAAAPWNPQNRLVRIGIKAREINANRRPPSNLVFLIDVSGSMNTPQKLPLVKSGLKLLVDRLGENDTVSIVVYAGVSGLVLPPTSAMRKERIQQAIDSLQPGGSTNGASGIQLAYNLAVQNFIRGGANRVILMTDGDFNVGITNQGDLTRLIEDRARSGVFLSVLGFGMGNIKDSTLERLADRGNGNYAYIDTINEARKVLVEEMGSTLVAVAKDVKIQVDFNPARVEAYRLIGYENRILRAEDFNNDLKDAGDMGAGHTVTALFEVVPKGGSIPGPSIDPSIYTAPQPQADVARAPGNNSNDMLTLRVRYKQPDGDTSTRMLDVPLVDANRTFPRATSDFRFAAAVAQFGMILRDSPYRGASTLESVLDTAEGSRGADRNGYRQEFIELVQRARRLR